MSSYNPFLYAHSIDEFFVRIAIQTISRYLEKMNNPKSLESFIRTFNTEDKELIRKAIINLINIDPTYVKGSDEVGSYFTYLLKLYKDGEVRLLDDQFNPTPEAKKVSDLLEKYEELKKLKKIPSEYTDISKFKSYSQFYDFMISVSENEPQFLYKRILEYRNKNNIKEGVDYDVVFLNNLYEVTVPHTTLGSCVLGSGTHWCTAVRRRNNAFESYNERGTLYIIQDLKRNKKYQIFVPHEGSKYEIADEFNNHIPFSRIFSIDLMSDPIETRKLMSNSIKIFQSPLPKDFENEFLKDISEFIGQTYESVMKNSKVPTEIDIKSEIKKKYLNYFEQFIKDHLETSKSDIKYMKELIHYFLESVNNRELLAQFSNAENTIEQIQGITPEDINEILERYATSIDSINLICLCNSNFYLQCDIFDRLLKILHSISHEYHGDYPLKRRENELSMNEAVAYSFEDKRIIIRGESDRLVFIPTQVANKIIDLSKVAGRNKFSDLFFLGVHIPDTIEFLNGKYPGLRVDRSYVEKVKIDNAELSSVSFFDARSSQLSIANSNLSKFYVEGGEISSVVLDSSKFRTVEFFESEVKSVTMSRSEVSKVSVGAFRNFELTMFQNMEIVDSIIGDFDSNLHNIQNIDQNSIEGTSIKFINSQVVREFKLDALFIFENAEFSNFHLGNMKIGTIHGNYSNICADLRKAYENGEIIYQPNERNENSVFSLNLATLNFDKSKDISAIASLLMTLNVDEIQIGGSLKEYLNLNLEEVLYGIILKSPRVVIQHVKEFSGLELAFSGVHEVVLSHIGSIANLKGLSSVTSITINQSSIKSFEGLNPNASKVELIECTFGYGQVSFSQIGSINFQYLRIDSSYFNNVIGLFDGASGHIEVFELFSAIRLEAFGKLADFIERLLDSVTVNQLNVLNLLSTYNVEEWIHLFSFILYTDVDLKINHISVKKELTKYFGRFDNMNRSEDMSNEEVVDLSNTTDLDRTQRDYH